MASAAEIPRSNGISGDGKGEECGPGRPVTYGDASPKCTPNGAELGFVEDPMAPKAHGDVARVEGGVSGDMERLGRSDPPEYQGAFSPVAEESVGEQWGAGGEADRCGARGEPTGRCRSDGRWGEAVPDAGA